MNPEMIGNIFIWTAMFVAAVLLVRFGLKRLLAPPDIEKLKEGDNVDGLVKALAHRHWRIRRGAAQSLGSLADFLQVPRCDWPDEPGTRPKRWPWRNWTSYGLTFRRSLELLRSCDVQPGEEAVGTLFVSLFCYTHWVTRKRGVVVLPGIKAQEIASKFKLKVSPSFPSHLVLFFTNHRIILTPLPSRFRRDQPHWSRGVKHVHAVWFRDTGEVLGERITRDWSLASLFGRGVSVLGLDFGDGHPLLLEVATPGWEQGGRQFPIWLEECGRFLQVVHSRDVAVLERYAQYMRAINRGGDTAVQALVRALGDEQEAVRGAAAEALARIGGPQAGQALADYAALKIKPLH